MPNYGDPLHYLHLFLTNAGIMDKFAVAIHHDPEYTSHGFKFLTSNLSNGITTHHGFNMLALDFYFCGDITEQLPPHDLQNHFVNISNHDGYIDSKSSVWSDAIRDEHSMDGFGECAPFINLRASCYIVIKNRVYTVGLSIGQPKKSHYIYSGIFLYPNLDFDQSEWGSIIMSSFEDISYHTNDFKPYLHRLIELYSDVPKEKWASPLTHLDEEEAYKIFVNKGIDFLFGEDSISSQLKASLNLRQGVISVPRLNLGCVILNGVNNGTHAIDSAIASMPYIAEALHLYCNMTQQEAQDAVEKRLAHHLLHNTDVQISYQAAIHARDALGRMLNHNSETNLLKVG